MNHRNTTLAIAAIVAAALSGVAFAIPQQVMAGGYYGHRHHNNNHNGNSIRVNQAVNQLNSCNTTRASPSPVMARSPDVAQNGGDEGGSGTVCLNIGSNSADIHGSTHR